MKCTFEVIQKAFVDEVITLEQFIEILVDNFGAKKTRKILRQNLALAIKKDEDRKLTDPQDHLD